ncbi:ExeA family protein [Desulfosoma sp.]
MDIYYPSPQHEEAWDFISQGIRLREQYILLLGDYGLGKSTLAVRLDKAMKRNGRILHRVVPNPNCSSRAILHLIASAFLADEELENQGQEEIQDRLIAFFQKEHKIRPVYVLFDDVHEADSLVTLPKLFSLSKITAKNVPVIRWIFFGHRSFAQILRARELEPLDQRIRRRFLLQPLTLTHTKEYIYFKLYRAGAVGVPRFTAEAIRKIYEYSAGVPRLINNVCDMALQIGASVNSMVIDEEIAGKAVEAMRLVPGFPFTFPEEGKEETPSELQEEHTAPAKRQEREGSLGQSHVALETEKLIGLQDQAADGEKAEKKKISLEKKILMITLALLILMALMIALRMYHVV